jgi:hypothetical protein
LINEFKINKLSGRISDDGDSYLTGCSGVHQQVWGQLMGSPVSFPLLCIINAAITRYSMEVAFGKTILLTDKAFLVNGDDVIFTIPDGQYDVWVKNVTSAGLSPSPGKNFVSRRYGVINSQVYDCGRDWDYVHSDIKVRKVPLVKMNLVHLVQHVTTERRVDEGLVIGEALRHGKTLEGRMEELVKGWEGVDRDRLLKRAYHYAKPLLAKLPPVSWVLPKCLGGLGLPCTLDHKVSDLHLKIASMILCLDADTRRDVVRLQWLREPGNLFCEETNEQIRELNETLGLKLILSEKQTEDKVYGRLIKSNLGLGADESVLEPKKALNIWKRMYNGWVKRVQKIKWTDHTEHLLKGDSNQGLHACNQTRALSYRSLKWTWECSVSWK